MTLSVLVTGEIDLASGELSATVDIILQRVRDSDMSFGGVLLLGNGDTNQLPAITGTERFLGSQKLFTFIVFF